MAQNLFQDLAPNPEPPSFEDDSKFLELLLHQMPKKLGQGLEAILLPNNAHKTPQSSPDESPSLLASLHLRQESKYKEVPEAWREQWYANCAKQALHSADSCWKLLQDFGLSYYVQESYFQTCYRQSSLCLERELRGEFTILLRHDSRYPSTLKQAPPRLLFWRGRFLPREALSTAIIGTRLADGWGVHQAWQEALLLQKGRNAASHWIISGLAHGCDRAAHRGALDGGGPTLALLPGGFDHIYPKQHEGLAQEIVNSGGALVSEYVPSAEPMKWRFIQRDRLQSTMAQRVLLVESLLDGGSMHTVRAALQLGKPVFTLDGTEACRQIADKETTIAMQGPEETLLEANRFLLREELAQLWR